MPDDNVLRVSETEDLLENAVVLLKGADALEFYAERVLVAVVPRRCAVALPHTDFAFGILCRSSVSVAVCVYRDVRHYRALGVSAGAEVCYDVCIPAHLLGRELRP